MQHHPAPQARLVFAFAYHPTPQAWFRDLRQEVRICLSFCRAYWKYASATSDSSTSSMTGRK